MAGPGRDPDVVHRLRELEAGSGDEVALKRLARHLGHVLSLAFRARLCLGTQRRRKTEGYLRGRLRPSG